MGFCLFVFSSLITDFLHLNLKCTEELGNTSLRDRFMSVALKLVPSKVLKWTCLVKLLTYFQVDLNIKHAKITNKKVSDLLDLYDAQSLRYTVLAPLFHLLFKPSVGEF